MGIDHPLDRPVIDWSAQRAVRDSPCCSSLLDRFAFDQKGPRSFTPPPSQRAMAAATKYRRVDTTEARCPASGPVARNSAVQAPPNSSIVTVIISVQPCVMIRARKCAVMADRSPR